MIHNIYKEAILGVDFGQFQRPTALPVTNVWLLAHAGVLPLGISYTQISKSIITTLANLRRYHPNIRIKTTVDSTGLGAAAIELLQREIVGYHSTHSERLA